MSCSFNMLNGEDIVTLLLRVARYVFEGFAFCEQYFKDVALVEL